MEIIEYTTKYELELKGLIQALHPSWFDERALENIPKDIRLQRCYVAIDKRLLGFISIFANEGIGQIGWLGVHPSVHRKGIGRKLLQHVEKLFKKIGINELRVETIIEQDPLDGTYDETIKFYDSMKFEIREKYKQEDDGEFTFRKGMLRKIL